MLLFIIIEAVYSKGGGSKHNTHARPAPAQVCTACRDFFSPESNDDTDDEYD